MFQDSMVNFLLYLMQGWDRYNGGLDIQNDMTGSQSYFTLFEEHQVMFHVSTLLPYSIEDTQQVIWYENCITFKISQKSLQLFDSPFYE